MAISVEQFIERLTQSGLLSAAEVSKFQDSLPPERRPKDVKQLAQVLVQQGKLTKYQAQAVYQDKTKGLVLGQYVVLDKLGEGGMGVVLKAQHRRMARLVAIKVLSSGAMKQAGAVERFHREVQAAAKLSHPNIVTAYDADEHQGTHYLAMEYVEGEDLASIVKQRGPLEVRQAVECILQAARGLQYAHEQGIVHRDIKPGNLLLDRKGTVKILDMGLARIAGADAALGGPERLTTTGQVMGTCDYMAPEQSLDTHQADARADIYSLGCTLYRLLTGHPPYQAETFAKLFLMHLEAPIPSLCQSRPEVPEALDAVCQRMLAKKPEDRYQSMAEVVAELEPVLAALSGRPLTGAAARAESPSAAFGASLAFLQEKTPSGPPTTQKKPIAADRTQPSLAPEPDTGSNIMSKAREAVAIVRRKPLLLAGIAGGLLLLLGIALVLALRHGGPAPSTESSVPGTQVDAPPPPAVAPFDAQQARKHQEAWARYLGLPVEMTNSIGMKLVLIPPGEFQMGSPKDVIEEELKANAGNTDKLLGERLSSEGPRHSVRITRPFYLGVYAVTHGEYEKVTGTNPSEFSAAGKEKDKVAGQDTKRFPAEQVSWDDCVEFCRKLSALPEEKTAGRTYRLPSEAQWEYACRAGSTGRFGFSPVGRAIPRGDDDRSLAEYGWFGDNSYDMPHPVGQKRPNAWGLYDMHGNVWQFCQDWWSKDYYGTSPVNDPSGPPGGFGRVTRGGCWTNPADGCRSAMRYHFVPGLRYARLGLRVSLVLADKPDGGKIVPSTEYSVPSTPASSLIPSPQSPIPPPGIKPLVGPDGEWKLPPGAPPPAVAPFDAAKAKEHQAAWAKHLKVPVEMSNSIGMTLVLIPPGEFDLGSPKELIEEELKRPSILESRRNRLLAEGPRHHVRITQPFYLGMYPVTQEEYRRVTGTNPSEFSATGKGKGKVVGQDTGQFPVEMVSWNDAAEFCRRISDLPAEKAARRRYQLPTEAQWEYACRAGSTGRFCFSREDRAIPKEDEDRELSEYGWFAGNSDGMPHAVGLKRANAWGLCDMHGTIWQFCQDWFGDAYYAKSPVNDPGGPSNGGWRMGRGGCWNTPALECRSAYRLAFETGDRYNFQGFRVSVVLPEKPGAPGTRHAAPSIGRPAPNTPSPAPSPAVPAAEAAARNTLAKRCRDVLDDRQRDLVACSQSWWCFNGNAWENRAGELYRLAGEVARAQGK